MSNDQQRDNSPKQDELVEQTVASLNIEGIRVPDDEKDILRKIANGELDADAVADAVVKKAIEDAKTKKT